MIRMMIKIILLLTSCLLMFGSVTHAEEPKETNLAHASNDLAFDLLRQYKNDKNVFISPFSISTALAMVYLGSNGQTAEKMREVLKYQQYGLSEQDVRDAFQSMQYRLKQNSDDYQFSTYNEVLVQQDFTILHIYGHALRQYYFANIASVDFASQGEEIKTTINAAVSNTTKGKIPNFLDEPPSSDTKLFLMNAVYFLGNWKNPFNPDFTSNRTFYNNGVTEKLVPMMNRDGRYEFSSSEDFKASVVVLPYKGDNTAEMIIVLPDERNGVVQLQEALTQDILNRMLSAKREQRINLTVPKFGLDFSANLVDALAHLGLEDLFGESADLSRIAGENARLKVSAIRHKAVIDVNERGSEAAGATGIEIIPLSSPPSITVERPFLFFIREKQNGMILFSGRVDEL